MFHPMNSYLQFITKFIVTQHQQITNNFIMTESPRKRILTQLSSLDISQKSVLEINPKLNKFKKLQRIFKFSPTHTHEISVPQICFKNSGRSKIFEQVDPLDQLNKIFKERKISEQKSFFNQKPRSGSSYIRSKSKINKDIQSSIMYIQNLRNKRNQAQSIDKDRYVPLTKQKNSVIQAIGLEFPQIKIKNENHSRFLTEPSIISQSMDKKNLKNKKQIGLYSYLQRDFIERKQQNLTENKIINYAKNPNNHNFHKIILQKSRKFLKHQAQNNFKQLESINDVIKEQSKKIIEQELKQKKQKYEKQYFARNNVPYFSFLTLNQKQKRSVIDAIHRKKSIF